MLRFARSYGLLGAVGFAVVGCGPAPEVDVTNTVEGVLPATVTSQQFADHVVYFNAMPTEQLTPAVAQQYGIVRSKSRALLNVSMHKDAPSGAATAVAGNVTASATNLNGQLKPMTLREIREGDAIYYIGEIAITDSEVLIFTIDARPSDASRPYTVRFKKQFFVDD